MLVSKWSGRPDLNRGPPAPKAGALPGCATPRHPVMLRQESVLIINDKGSDPPNVGTMACDYGEIEFGYRWVRTLCGVFARSGICLACNRFHSDPSWHGTFGLS